MRVFLHQIIMQETYTDAMLVYNTTFRGGERSAIHVMPDEEELWRAYRMSSGSN